RRSAYQPHRRSAYQPHRRSAYQPHRRSSFRLQVPGASLTIRNRSHRPHVRVRTQVPGGSVTIGSGSSRWSDQRSRACDAPRQTLRIPPVQTTRLEYSGPRVPYTERWSARPAPSPYFERALVIPPPVSPAPNASGAP
ncbi:MAG: hypothetical protein JKY65_14565, partial [Planctomycetes bacterium]|nr:hypothetical protein [Planctomycetota bacterium]